MGLVSWVKDKASSVSDGAQNAWDSAVDKAKSVDLKAAGHMALDVAGMVPVVGAAADVANAGWYAAEGDWTNAALSAAGAVPGIGDAATAAKLGAKAVNGAQALASTNKAANAVTTTTTAAKAAPTSTAKTPTTAGTKTTPKPATASGAKPQSASGASSKPSKPAGSNETPSAVGGGKSGGNGPTDRTGKAPGADGPGNEPSISDRIDDALRSNDPDVRLEGEVADALRKEGIEVVGFQKKIGPNGEIGEIDVETPNAIIEVTTAKAGKKPQLEKLTNNKDMNPHQKPVILYAPNYGRHASNSAADIGIEVIKDTGALIRKILGGI